MFVSRISSFSPWLVVIFSVCIENTFDVNIIYTSSSTTTTFLKRMPIKIVCEYISESRNIHTKDHPQGKRIVCGILYDTSLHC